MKFGKKDILKVTVMPVVALSVFFVTSCSTLDEPDKKGDKTVKEPDIESLFNKDYNIPVDRAKPRSLEDETVKAESPKAVVDAVDISNLSKDSKGRTDLQRDVTPFYTKFIEKDKNGESEISVSFNDTSIADVVPAFAKALGFNYIIDPAVRGTVTMQIKSKMKKKELWQVFEQMLLMVGAYCSPSEDLIRILPFAKLPQERRTIHVGKPSSNVEIVQFMLKHVAAADVLAQLAPFLSEGSTAIEQAKINAILVVDVPANITKIQELLKLIDRSSYANWAHKVIHCQNIPATRIAQELTEVLPVLGFPVTTDMSKKEAGAINIAALDRIQIIVISAATAKPLDEVSNWIKTLDCRESSDQEMVFVYDVINGNAADLAKAVSVIFPVEGTTITAQNTTEPVKVADTREQQLRNANTRTQQRQAEEAKKYKSTAPISIFDVPVKMFADAVSNRLIVRTTPRTYAMIKALLSRLDTMPAQVLLQVMIIEVTLNDDFQFGVEFNYTTGGKTTGSEVGTNYLPLVPQNNNDKYPQTGGKFAIFNPNNPDEKFGYVKALSEKTNVKLVSSPQVLVNSHAQAKISVGAQVPVITSETTDTQSSSTESTTLLRSVEYKNTGTILTVTPHVTRGGMITFNMKQEISEAIVNESSTIDSPEIRERVLETAMTMRTGRTLIIGGLIKESTTEKLSTLPVIDGIPFLKNLLGNTTHEKVRTELLLLITATIVTEKSKLEELVARYKQSVDLIRDFQYKQNMTADEYKEYKKKQNTTGLKKAYESFK